MISDGGVGMRSRGILGGDAEAGEPHATGVVDECVGRLDVLVDEAPPMCLAEGCRQTNANVQKADQIGRLSVGLLYHPV